MRKSNRRIQLEDERILAGGPDDSLFVTLQRSELHREQAELVFAGQPGRPPTFR